MLHIMSNLKFYFILLCFKHYHKFDLHYKFSVVFFALKIKTNVKEGSLTTWNKWNSGFVERLSRWYQESQTCSIGGDGVQFDSQRVVGLSVVLQRMAVTTAPIKEPLPTEHCSVCQVQPQVLSHLTLLTLPATTDNKTDSCCWCAVFNHSVVPSLTFDCKMSVTLLSHPGHGSLRSSDGEASGLL